ncbi:matrixin family metalloprotease [Chengkuizengella axinellae]|uniref:Matrixin family metalloprotease n=1 Tax=Chengkuizengella axinellae TaxID=3064388 RepID=A0ABT9J608_9BACL|nr:matrixin family metalloprotease [Chengkuizengella sp. 2205SS18-9]MDP5277060.1 matrixin family metalloprotease [Chengkuizengella sp. 2205SS18-9]
MPEPIKGSPTPYYNMRYPTISKTNSRAKIYYAIMFEPKKLDLKYKEKFENAWKTAIQKWTDLLDGYVDFEESYDVNNVNLFLRGEDKSNLDWVGINNTAVKETVDGKVTSEIKGNVAYLNMAYIQKDKYTDERAAAIAMHEIGHALSLDHNKSKNVSVMYDSAFSTFNNFLLSPTPTSLDTKPVKTVYLYPVGEAVSGLAPEQDLTHTLMEEDYSNPNDALQASDVAFEGIVLEKGDTITQDGENYWSSYKVRLDQPLKGCTMEPSEFTIHQFGGTEGGCVSRLKNLRYLLEGDRIVFMGKYRDDGILSAVNEWDGLFIQNPDSNRFSCARSVSRVSNIEYSFEQLLYSTI